MNAVKASRSIFSGVSVFLFFGHIERHFFKFSYKISFVLF